jgi:NCS1 family nucleobase:cation symporter-1
MTGHPGPDEYGIEQRTIQPIPRANRHGRAFDLFTLWFGSNVMMLSILTGALGPILFKLQVAPSLLAIAAGNLLGGIFMALHAAQGPRLGLPQMIQSRAQFGSRGALLVVGVVIIMNLGFFASTLVLGGQALNRVSSVVGDQRGIGFMACLSLAAAIYGYDWIHRFGRWMTWGGGAALLISFVWIFEVSGLPGDVWTRGEVSAGGFFGMVAAAALWQISYSPYVSDYSRYMDAETGARPAFWASYTGSTAGSILTMGLGVLVGIQAGTGTVIDTLAGMLGGWGYAAILIFSIGLGAASAMNIYCGVLSIITLTQTFLPRWQAGARSRILLSLIFSGAALMIALLGARNFLTNYENFLAVLLCVMAPWTAINLADFYLVRHGAYKIDALLSPDGGIYGRYNGTALACYAFGIAIQIPFLVTAIYTGPAARALGGIDISWLLGLITVGPLYTVAARSLGRNAGAN